MNLTRIKLFMAACMAVCLCALVPARAVAQTTIYGAYLYSESAEMQPGIWSFPASADATFTNVFINGDLRPNGGAVYANGKYYVVSYMDMGFMMLAYMLVFDMETYEIENTVMIEDWNVSYVTSDMTYDPSTGNIYACSLNADASGSFNLSLFDTSTGRQTPIAPIERMCALAASPDGTLYGISADDGTLYTIDKTTAALTEIGSTGVQPENNQSATIDETTGVMYWSAYTADGGALYTVDTTTGQATHVFSYGNKTQLIGIYTLKPEHKEPASPTEVALNFDGGSLDGSLDFTMPVNDFDQNPLEDVELNYELTVDVDNKLTGTAAPGEKVSLPLSFEEAGSHLFSLSASNAYGASAAVNFMKFVGFDTPKPVTDVVIGKEGDNTVTLTWALPETGVNDGYIDHENVTYRIVRQPDNVLVEENFVGTDFSEVLTPEEKRICYYEVAAKAAGNTGVATISNYVILGEHYVLPVDDDLTDWTLYPLYTVIDSNADNATWRYSLDSGSVMYEWAFADNNDDWFITPSMYMEAGKQYVITASMRNDWDDVYTGVIEYAVGAGTTVDVMRTVADNIEVTSSQFEDYKSEPFSVNADGYYNVGIHIKGDDSTYYVYLGHLAIEESENGGMAEVGTAGSIRISRSGNTVSISNPQGLSMQLYNAAGQIVGESSEIHLDLQLCRGVYLLRSAEGCRKFVM